MKNKQVAPLKARVCYGHLGGALGERSLHRFVELGWLDGMERSPWFMKKAGSS